MRHQLPVRPPLGGTVGRDHGGKVGLLAKIAFVAPLTGPEAVVGVPMMKTVRLAVEAFRQDASLPFELQLVGFNDEADPGKARTVAERLAADESVLGVVGHKNSGPCAAAGPIYASAGLAQLTPSATNTRLAQQGWPTFFRLCADNERQARAAARFALAELQVTRVATVHDNTDYGRPLAETFISAVEDGGAEVVLVEEVALGQRDFRGTVEALAGAEADLIYFGLTEIESSYLVRTLHDVGVSSLCFGADGGPTSPFPDLAGEVAEGVYEALIRQQIRRAVISCVPVSRRTVNAPSLGRRPTTPHWSC